MQKVQCEMLSLLVHALPGNFRASDDGLILRSTFDGLIGPGFYAFQPLFLVKRFFVNRFQAFSHKRLRAGCIHLIFDRLENLSGVSFANPLRVPANFLSHIFLFLSNSILDFHAVKWFSVCESKLIDHFFCQSYIQRPRVRMTGRSRN